MKKIAYGLILTLLIGVFSSFGMMSVAAVEEIGEDEDVSVLLDVDFTQCEITADLLNIPGIELSGLYELGIAPDGTTALKLCKDGGEVSTNEVTGETTTIREADPGTVVATWNNGRENGAYRIQMDIYVDAPGKNFMQAPVVFADIKDTGYNEGEGLNITKVSYDDSVGGKVRVYANTLAGIAETDNNNWLAVNDNKANCAGNRWITIDSMMDTITGSCSANIPEAPAGAEVTRNFADSETPDAVGNFAPNQLTSIASKSRSSSVCDTYIKRILVTGPEGESTPIVPVTPPDYEITALNLTDADGAAAELGTATKIGSVAVNRASHIKDKEYTVLVVEYKDNVFSRLHIKKYEPAAATTEGDMSLQLSPQTYEENTIIFDEDLSEGTTSVKVMLWNSFDDLAPIAKVYK